MRQTVLIEMSREELGQLMLQTLQQHEEMKANKHDFNETCSINKAAKLIGVAHDTAKKLIREGQLKTTADQRRVQVWSINEYLKHK